MQGFQIQSVFFRLCLLPACPAPFLAPFLRGTRGLLSTSRRAEAEAIPERDLGGEVFTVVLPGVSSCARPPGPAWRELPTQLQPWRLPALVQWLFPTRSLDVGTLGLLSISRGSESARCTVGFWQTVLGRGHSWHSVDHVGLGGGGWLLGDLSPVS